MMKQIKQNDPPSEEPIDEMIRKQEKYYQIMEKREQRQRRRLVNRKPRDDEIDPKRCQKFRYSVDYKKFLNTFYSEMRSVSAPKESSLSKINSEASASAYIMQSGSIDDAILLSQNPKDINLRDAVRVVLQKQTERVTSDDACASRERILTVSPALDGSRLDRSAHKGHKHRSAFLERTKLSEPFCIRATSLESSYQGQESSILGKPRESTSNAPMSRHRSRTVNGPAQPLPSLSPGRQPRNSKLRTGTNITLSTKEVSLLASTRYGLLRPRADVKPLVSLARSSAQLLPVEPRRQKPPVGKWISQGSLLDQS